MEIRRGIAVSPGVAIGSALVLGNQEFHIPRRFVEVDAVETEVARFLESLREVAKDIGSHEELASARLGKQYGAIFAAHLQLAQDPKLIREVESHIRDRCYAPEFAVSRVLRRHAKQLQDLGDPYLAERAHDLFDLERRIVRELLGHRREELSHLNQPVVVVAANLTPSETANLDTRFVQGFVTEAGGKSSHTAILAGALEIPAVVGVGPFLTDLAGGDTLVIDGNTGTIVIDPDESTLRRYRDNAIQWRKTLARRETLKNEPSRTLDGVDVHLYGNIEFPDEVEHCTRRGAEGIGLYRTEFLYLQSDLEPSEEQQYDAYCKVLRSFPGRPVVVRTLDLGAEKFPSGMHHMFKADNPCLGLRSLRLSLQNLPMFRKQLRAVLRAGVEGDLRMMFPLVSTLLEFRQAKMIVADVMEDLAEEGIPYRRDIPIGMMVEVPSAAIMASEFAPEVDFFSIGTNDLIQYTLAVDRGNLAVANLYSSADPSIMRLIRLVVEAGQKHDVPVSICGQMSSDPIYTPLLIGMGVRHLSVTPASLPEVKEVVRHLTLAQSQRIADHVAHLEVARDVESYLREELKRLCPDFVLSGG